MIESDLKTYSKKYDWPSYVSDADINRNIKWILNQNEELLNSCKEHNFTLINTSRGEKRDKIIDNIIDNLLEGKYENNRASK